MSDLESNNSWPKDINAAEPTERCPFCETRLEWRRGPQVIRFTAHDDAFCKATMMGIIRALRAALTSQAEVMARACRDHGAQTERDRRGRRE